MKLLFLIAHRSLIKNKATSFLLFINIFFSAVLLDIVIIGGDSLRAAISVSENSFIAPLVLSASMVFSVIIAVVSFIFLQNGLLISIEKRSKTLSQFCSIGCGNKLLKKSVALDLGILTGIAIPSAIAFCHIGMIVVFSYLNSYNAITQRIGNLNPVYSIGALVALIIYVIVVLLFSSFQSMRKIAQASPIINLKQSYNFSGRDIPKKLLPKGNLMAQMAKRNLKMYARRYRVISIGIAFSLILMYTSSAFASGINLLYSSKSKPFDYRVVIWGDAGVEPTDLLNECANVDKKLESIKIEELNYSLYNQDDGLATNVKIIVLQDKVFLNWYGKELVAEHDMLPCIQANSISKQAIQQSFNISQLNCSIVGTTDKNTPLNIGNMESNDNTVVLFTYQSIFQQVFQANGDRMFAVYYNVEDGRALNSKIETLLSGTGTRYLIQDYTDTSAWHMQREALTILLKTISVCFPILVFLIFIVEMLTSLVSSILVRRKEIALCQCVGLSRKSVIKMLIYESCYYMKNGVLLGVPIGLLLSCVITKNLGIKLFDALTLNTILIPIISLLIVLMISFVLIKILTDPISLTKELSIDY